MGQFKMGLLLMGFLLILCCGFIFFGQNWKTNNSKDTVLNIKKSISIDSLEILVEKQFGISFCPGFGQICHWIGYDHPSPIYLVVKPKTSVWNLAKLLLKYQSETSNWVLRSSWYNKELVVSIAGKIPYDEKIINGVLSDSIVLASLGVNRQTWPVLFIPNTYNLKKSTTPIDWLKRMKIESDKFWTKNREQKLLRRGISKLDAVIIASIVTKESNKIGEFGKIASVYLMRLKRKMPLQADPTIVFARGRAGRVLSADLKINSAYNTYLYSGLPPGPICIPDPQAIDSCLFGRNYPYLYFCANSNMQPEHLFETTLEAHNKNARAYHRALNAIKK